MAQNRPKILYLAELETPSCSGFPELRRPSNESDRPVSKCHVYSQATAANDLGNLSETAELLKSRVTMGMRRELRLGISLPVRVAGVDKNGKPFEFDAMTIDVTGTGARLRGITRPLQPGSAMILMYRFSKAQVHVRWVGKPGRTQDQIGVQLAGPGQLNWGRPLPRIFGDGFPTPAEARD